jgi:hypothetical protein
MEIIETDVPPAATVPENAAWMIIAMALVQSFTSTKLREFTTFRRHRLLLDVNALTW